MFKEDPSDTYLKIYV